VTPSDYEYLRRLLKERSGLDLSADKQYLVESRLVPLARKADLPGISELVQKMKGSSAEVLVAEVVEAMTTNETFFFRDKIPFDHLKDALLPSLMQARAARRTLRFWCAASSTGQEPYSIAMILKEMPALSGWRTEIVATDLSQAVLEKSKAGIFSQFEVQRGLPIQMLVKYFKQNGDLWQLNPDIRAMVQHKQLNLLQDFSHLGTFDVIFCRNVLIYFDQSTKAAIFERMSRIIEPDGVLALGAAESVVGITDVFKPYPDRRGMYCPNTARTAPRAAGAPAVQLKLVAAR